MLVHDLLTIWQQYRKTASDRTSVDGHGLIMFGSRCLNYSEHGRPFWLLVAIAVTLLVNVSTTISQAATAVSLVQGLKRDVGAIRAQLEQADPHEPDAGWRTMTFNAELGDGGPAFRRQSLATMLHAARRRGDQLLAGYHQAAAARQIRLAHQLRLQLQDLQRHLDQRDAIDRPGARPGHDKVEALLDEVDRTLEELGPASHPRG
jgi:hypothetical protein